MVRETSKIEEIPNAFKQLSETEREKALALMEWIKDKRANG